ncbi:MAG: trypsin-like peptidase domain-containing protein [Spirochaetales bacterium]|nr:trypsin-like peptidase domain-containing protein [Spirochaetales bacterium]
MRNGKLIYTAVFMLLFLLLDPAGISAEIIVLKGGIRIEAAVVMKNDNYVVVDIGFDILKIPRDYIFDIRKNDGNISRDEENSHIYHTGISETLTTVEAVNRFSPSVLMIKTPGQLGSGFFINKEGYLITNFHVIQNERHISVVQYIRKKREMNQQTYNDVRIISLDPFHDLAVLKIEETLKADIVPVFFFAEDKPVVGEKVFVIGNPLGLERTVTEGVVSHSGRNFGGKLFIQIDAPVNPGNSGGPLFNMKGQVVGVVCMGVYGMEGLNFAIPARDCMFLLDNLDAYAYNESNSETGVYYPPAPRKPGNK